MHRKKVFLNFKRIGRQAAVSVCLQSIMENSGISQKLKCKQWQCNNMSIIMLQKIAFFQSLSTHGWMSIGHWRQFFIAKSINFLLLEFLFMKLQKTLSSFMQPKNVYHAGKISKLCLEGNSKKQRRQEGHQDMTSLSHSQ